jgi:hypothetical protein
MVINEDAEGDSEKRNKDAWMRSNGEVGIPGILNCAVLIFK